MRKYVNNSIVDGCYLSFSEGDSAEIPITVTLKFSLCRVKSTLKFPKPYTYFKGKNRGLLLLPSVFYCSKMSHPRCVYINNRCGYLSITQQYLKICLIKDEVNYMFRPNVAIIRFSSESMVVVLYRIGMGMSRW